MILGLAALAFAGPSAELAPAVPQVPANHLKFYVQFSEPMRPVRSALDPVALMDRTTGEVVPTAFAHLPLWSADRDTLTLLLHPGRQKRAVGFGAELGAVLEEGHSYEVRVVPGLQAVVGEPMDQVATLRFDAVAPDRTRPDPSSWTVLPPDSPSGVVLVDLHEPVDPFLAARAFVVQAADGSILPTTATVDGGQVRLAPTVPWPEGTASVVQVARVEDLAGNTAQALFDRAPGDRVDVPPFEQTFELPAP
ncbi:MAG: hypothetical protein ACI8PZ_002035 [Myxococcota bacterium]|jgi:hypothetical protein